MIEVKGLTKTFGDFTAVNDINFRIESESGIIGLLGPNGAGKTTTMRLLTGYLRPTSGSISIHGISPTDEESLLEIKSNIGYLPESTPLYMEMLVSEYLEFMGRIRGLNEDLLEERAREMVEKLALASHLYTPIGLLSKGFRQRTALAGALIHKPSLIILDEPTTGLDPNQIIEIRSLLRELGKESTLILSTHILQEVEDVCERVIIINQGTITADESTANLRRGTAYSIVARTQSGGLRDGLAAMSLVSSCDERPGDVPQGYTRCHVVLKDDAPEQLFAQIAAAGWQVREFAPVSRSLQEVFRERTN